MVRFYDLQKAACRLPYNHPVWDALGNAGDIATDTIEIEHAAPRSQWHKIALDSIAFTNAYQTNAKVRAWFKARGYEG